MPGTPPGLAPKRARAFELFFDLVFAFALTQITQLIVAFDRPREVLTAAAVVALVWWIYCSFAWLATHLDGVEGGRPLTLAALAAVFFLGIGIDGLARGQAAMFFGATVTLGGLQALALMACGTRASVAGARVHLGVNVLAAGLIGLSLVAPPLLAWLPQLCVLALLLGTGLLFSGRARLLAPGRYIERHALFLVILFGEAVILAGTSVGGIDSLRAGVEVLAALGLGAASWLMFALNDEPRAERRMTNAPVEVRGRMALLGYWGAVAVMIAGLLTAVAAIRLHFAPLPGAMLRPELLLPAGIALYLAGTGAFLRSLALRPARSRGATALAALAVGAVAPWIGFVATELLLTALVTVALAAEALNPQFRPAPV